MAGKGRRRSSRKLSDTEKQAIKLTKKSEGKCKPRFHIDIFNESAMENAYYTCHNVQDVLQSRGFPWTQALKKKKRGKKR
ncbi:hypothetical protein PR048_007351 [Dryococelus australis]|uniref:Small lysine-rich protein 1 n=1 Tax=Dryococelus australis TaxID=614101 RepID=A0ABQ9IDD8_9NEOP|nr:hypothetical protein PR048_007351 [Dryococelus australis]